MRKSQAAYFRERNARPSSHRAKTEFVYRIKLRIWEDGKAYPENNSALRPRTRGDCEGGIRPCPWVGCKYNLYLDVLETGSIKYNFPDLEPHEMKESCALDVAKKNGMRLEHVGALVNVTREAVRLIEARATKHAKTSPLHDFAEGRTPLRRSQAVRLQLVDDQRR